MKKWLLSLCFLCLAGIGAVSLRGVKAASNSGVFQRAFPGRITGALPYDVDTERVGALIMPLRTLEREGKTEEAKARLLAAQREFDILSWQAFLALNFPVTSDSDPVAGTPITSKTGQPRWNFWRSSQSIFLPNGEKPAPWDAPAAAALQRSSNFTFLKTKAAWRQTAAPEDNFQAFSGPLVDQNGKWVRYEALVDHEEFNYIVNNELYSIDGQIAFSRRDAQNYVDFPANQGHVKHGAIEIKLSWKEMSANDDEKRFYTQRVKVKIAGPPGPDGKPQFRQIKSGLVGMHISMRTSSSPEWIWATFEQIDNVRSNPLEHGGGMSHPSFTNPATPNAPVNLLPAKNAAPAPSGSQNFTTWFESLTTTPVQVSRVNVPTQPGLNDLDAQIGEEVKQLNQQVQALLAKENSVFQYYELIGTQWPVHKNAPAVTGGNDTAPESIAHKTPGDMLPVFLVNTTMETYFQKGLQKAGPLEEDDRLTDNSLIDSSMVTGTESCVGCHYSAGIAIGYKRNLDGTWAMADGKRVPIFGDRNNTGKVGGAHFSWMLQLEASSPNRAPVSDTPAVHKSGIKPNVQP
jgi:hypothetical protein